MKNGINVAVVGATGAVGEEMISVLADSDLILNSLRPMSSERSAGQTISFRSETVEVIETTLDAFDDIDVALFSAGSEVSLKFGRALVDKGITVIDNSRAFRMEPDVPLVVPEVNPDAISPEHLLIANPNCSTIQLVVALEAARQVAPLKRVTTSTYQSASGAGRAAMDELRDQTIDLLNFRVPKVEHFTRRLAFDVLPQIDAFAEDGFTLEEHKMINETRKILDEASLPVCATCVRVPVFVGHALSLNIEFATSYEFIKLIEALEAQQGVIFHKAPEDFPTTADVTGVDEVFVGRLRRDPSVPNGAVMWVVADNLRKGAATNAVQILQLLQTQGRWN
jgi:aspartate-semialdehyde dehydrogenase